MRYSDHSESEAWGDPEFGESLEMDGLELFGEGETEMLDPEFYEEMLDELSRVRPTRPRFFKSRRPVARRRILRRRPNIPQPPRRRPTFLPGLIRQTLVEPIADIADSPVDVSDAPVDVDAAPADTGDSTVDQSDSPSDADDPTATEYELTFEDFNPIAVESPGGNRIQNKTDPKPADVETLVGVGGRSIKLHRLAAAAWRALVKAARADGIAEPLLLIVSAYRSSEHQKKLWEAALRKYGSREEARKWVAPPGGSAHQSGRAIDFHLGGKNSSANIANLRKLPAYKWLAANAQRFGFYPYTAEPWHWEYNPAANYAAPSRKAGPSARPAPCCVKALRDATSRWPLRNKASDGIMGDAAHQARVSDHNLGNAFDLTHDPVHGVDCHVLSLGVIKDPRVTYVIWNHRIYNRSRAAEGWRKYTGSNPHTKHMHVSIRAASRNDLSPWPWS